MKEELITSEISTYRGSSTLEAATSYEFDVFLNFRGSDLRKKFTSHLYERLKGVGFRVYLDEKEMHKGEEINEDLKRAIVNSRICMPIFSKNYASSNACLLELSHMMQCKKKIIPIFYDVAPDDVKLKTSIYREHLENYRDNPKIELDEVVKWEKALVTVAKKSGYDLLDKNEAEEITSITRDLVFQLMPKHQNVSDKLVEIEYEVKHIEELLDLSSNDFRIVGIFGMGGIGKTTLAKVIFNRFELNFPSSCSFLENVRESLENKRLMELQRQLYNDIIDSKVVDFIYSPNHGISMIKQGLAYKKALLVLDDINEEKQLTDLVGDGVHFKGGSRLIITTRDRRVLDFLGKKYNVLAYSLKEMDKDRSLKLFSKNAFMKDSPPLEFKILSEEVVSYTLGLPLAIEVFGSSLFGKSKDAWNEILEELKKFPVKRIEDILMTSYQGLKPNQQNIFLDIASYYGNLNKEYACYMWEDCGWCPQPAIKALHDCSLIKISGNAGSECLWMHDVLKDLGRALIQAESGKNGKTPSRLRIDNSLDLLHGIKEKGNVETLTIDAPDITITSDDMVGFENLRFLKLRVNKVKGDFKGLFPNLRWLYCAEAKEFEPIILNPKKLVVLDIRSATRLKWKGMRRMKVDRLKTLDLYSDDERSFGFFQDGDFKWILSAINLERLSLGIGYTVTGIEEMGTLSRVKDLILREAKFKCSLRLPSSLLHLRLEYCEFVKGFLDVSDLKNLISLRIRNPKKLDEIRGFEKLYSLEVLHLTGLNNTNCLRQKGLMINILTQWYLKNMKGLEIGWYKPLKELPDVSSMRLLCSVTLCGPLTSLSLQYCPSLEILPNLSTMRKLRSLTLWGCNKLRCIQGIPQSESLEIVQIIECDSLELSPHDFSKLENVQSVYIGQCRKLPYISTLCLDIWKSIEIKKNQGKEVVYLANLKEGGNGVDKVETGGIVSTQEAYIFSPNMERNQWEKVEISGGYENTSEEGGN